ncbi:MAG TPA: polysaccharide deacetylase [Myxococcota bacterium]
MWPEAARCAVAFSFDFDAEEVWIEGDSSDAQSPGPLSQGAYGAKVGVGLVLEILARRGVAATFFVPGRVAERHAPRVREIAAAGHELGHHGYTHTPPTRLSRDEEAAELTRGKRVLEAFGAEVAGYRSPSWDLSPHTLPLLQEHGFRYSSNLMDDIRPYRHEAASIVEVPVQWILDDAAHFWFDASTWSKKISTPDEVRSIWREEFLGIRRLGGCCVFTLHPQIIGRPGRLPLLDELVGFVQGHDDVWIATCGDIAACLV